MRKKTLKRKCLSMLMAALMLITALPMASKAAPASDIPAEMLDNVYLDALAYTGYDVQEQKRDGTIFKLYRNQVPEYIRSNIGYDTGPSGLETVSDKSTVSGLAPNIFKFESSGLCCASYVSYVYYNYMTNVAGIDTSVSPRPDNPRSTISYNNAANEWVNNGQARRISFKQNSDGSGFSVSEPVPIGSLIVYKNISSGTVAHVAIYAGRYDSKHWVTHVGTENGPEFAIMDTMHKGSSPQAVVQIVVPEFVEAYGAIEIQKNDTDGKGLAGAFFTATSTENKNLQYLIGPTNAKGYAISDERVKYGEYTIKETVFPKNYRSYGQSEWTVNVTSANNGIVKITAVNELIPGNIKIIKESEDGDIANIEFRIEGNGVDLTVYSGADGTITAKDLKPGTYTVTENAYGKYVQPEPQQITVLSGQTTTVNFSNLLKKWKADIYKLDQEYGGELLIEPYALLDLAEESAKTEFPYGEAQGDATLEGAVYGVYENDVLVKTYTTDKHGHFTTDYFTCGDGWTIKEITPSTGYLLNEDVYHVPAYCDWYTEEYNLIEKNLGETVIKNQIALVKHADDGSTQFDTPEAGAEFEVYLKSSGSYEKAIESERDIIVIDKYGYGLSKELPYGVYVVKQISGREDVERFPAFEVNITSNTDVYSYIINNAPITALIDVVKKDATTGKVIPASGVGFKVRSLATGKFITQHINYPTPLDIDTFYTNEKGQLRLPEALRYGEYELIEQTVGGALGYVLNKTPIKFVVDGSNKIVTVDMMNTPQMGTITIEKKGDVFASVKKEDGRYIPIYEEKGLAGAVFGIYAAEDISTLDGTLRYAAGDKVATLTTDEDGLATSERLFLGKYTIKEEQAPFGTVLSKEDISAELVYAGETVEVTATTVSVINKRQKASIELKKELEQDKERGIGHSDEYKNVIFGLYAAETLTAADGSIIPKDGLLELIHINKEGVGKFSTDIPVGAKLYVKEVATDEHYLLSDILYPLNFDYQGETVATVKLLVNGGKPILNKLNPDTIPSAPQTGDTSTVLPWILLGCGMLGVVVSLVIIRKKKRK